MVTLAVLLFVVAGVTLFATLVNIASAKPGNGGYVAFASLFNAGSIVVEVLAALVLLKG